MLVNMALSESFNKLMERLGENITKYAEKEECKIQETQEQRPASPFLLLLSEGDEEFNLNRSSGSSVDDGSEGADHGDLCEEALGEYTCSEGSNGDMNLNKTSSHLNDELECHVGLHAEENDIMKESDKERLNSHHPLTPEEFEKLFDHSGRLVNEHELRRTIFKGGVIESIRKEVWQFLFELYPFDTTAREREILKVEQTVRYEAMKIRWKKLLKTLVSDYEGIAYCPKWYTGCSKPKQLRKSNVYPFSKCLKSDSLIDVAGIGTGTEFFNIKQDGENKLPNILPQPVDLGEKQRFDSSCPLLSRTNSFASHAVTESTVNKDGRLSINGINTVTESIQLSQCDNIYNIKEMITEAMMDTDTNIINSQDILNVEVNTILNDLTLLRLGDDVSHTCSTIEPPSPTIPISDNHEDSHYSKSEQFIPFSTSSTSPSKEVSDISRHFCNTIDDNSYNTAGRENFCVTKNESEFCNPCHCASVECSNADTNVTTTEKLNIAHNSTSATHYNEINASEVDGETLRFPNNDNILLYNDGQSKSVDLSSKELTYPSSMNSTCTSISSNNNYTTVGFSKDSGEKDSLGDYRIPHTLNSINMVSNNRNIDECPKEKKILAEIIKNEPDNDETETLCEHCDFENPVSLSTECLENLPSWIVQVINASTPPRRKSDKEYKRSKEEHTSKSPCDEFIRAMDEDINKRKELMGIIENANKYLKEKANIVASSTIVIPCKERSPDNLPTICNEKTQSIKETTFTPYSLGNINKNENVMHTLRGETVNCSSSFMTPISSCGSDLFLYERPHFQLVTNDDTNVVDSTCPYCNCNPEDAAKISAPSSLGEEQLKFMQIQAQVYAARQPYNRDLISESIRVIDKDVPRTDRELSMFQGNENIGLVKLRDALLTYAFFNPDVGYAQGMNDIMARFLVVMDMESEAYWMFVRYMEHFKHHFMEEGMLQKISLVEQLLMKMDRDLYDYLQKTDLGLMFCHRWLLLNFKREFEYKEAIRLFEITSSRHLEVSSLEAELERSKERAKEFVKDSAGSHLEEIYMSPEIPFDIFVCVAMLMECRHMLMDTSDISAIYEILSNLPNTLDLQNILEKAETLFYSYCRRTVVDCFQVIDELEVEDFQQKHENSLSFSIG